MKPATLPSIICMLCLVIGASTPLAAAGEFHVRVSPRDHRYFELADGSSYVPIGLNLISPGASGPDGLERMNRWMQQLAANGGNFIRIWLSSPFWDVEHSQSGVYDESRARRIDDLLSLARIHGLKVKLTLEHFREMSENPRQPWANKPLHLVARGGTASSVTDFFSGESSRRRFREKLEWLAKRYGDDPTIFGWELWNEINAVSATAEHYLPWTESMLAELHRLFPRNLAMQSLGSYDSAGVRELYRRHSLLPGNDVAQVHRYLDLGAPLEICHGPMDMLVADAVRDLLGFSPGRPVLLAEAGAVEPRHTGPFKLYAEDRDGVLLHDVLFSPFFAGAAGPGQIWHWDVYVDRNNLWHHFSRFAEAIGGIDAPAENFEPIQLAHPRLRIYALKGQSTFLAWCRDAQNSWERELAQGHAPEQIDGTTVDLASVVDPAATLEIQVYDPWKNFWSATAIEGTGLALPAFSRSIVIRIRHQAP